MNCLPTLVCSIVLITITGTSLFSQEDNPLIEGGAVEVQLEKPKKSGISSNRTTESLAGIASIWIDPIDAGKKYRFKLELLGCEDGVTFDRVESSCQCGKLKLDGQEFRLSDKLNGELIWHAPKTSKTGHAMIRLTFYAGKNAIAEVRLFASLSGCIHVDSFGEGRRVDNHLYEWKIPIAVTTPITAENVDISLSSELDGFTVDLEKSELLKGDSLRTQKGGTSIKTERLIAVVRGHEELVGNRFRFGTLLIETSERPGKTFAKELVLSVKPLLRISPIRLSFREVSNDKAKSDELSAVQNKVGSIEGVLESNALLQLDAQLIKKFTEASEVSWKELMEQGEIKALLYLEEKKHDGDMKKIEVELKHLGRSVFRLVSTVDKDQFRSKSLKGEWRISVGDQNFNVPTLANLKF